MKMTIIKQEEIRSDRYEKNYDWFENHNNGGYPCAICGKEIKDDWNRSLHLFDGGGLLTDFEEEFPEELRKCDERFSAAGDMLWYPVGITCYKKWLKMKTYGKYDVDV